MTLAGLSAQAAADLVGGRLLGDGTRVLRRASPLDRAGADAVSLMVSARYLAEFRRSSAGAVLLPEMHSSEPDGPTTRIIVADPYRAMLALLPALYPMPSRSTGIDPTARIGAGAVLGDEVLVGAGVVIGRGAQIGARCHLDAGVVLGDGVKIGNDSVLGPNVVCYPGTRLGCRVIVKAGAVIGGDGFGYVSGRDGHTRIPHVGGCVLGDEVEVGSNTTIDRGSIDDTVIGRGTKIDNLVQIGHNVRIGERCLIMGMVGIGGSSRVGDGAVVAGRASVIDHVTIGEQARVGAGSLVISDVPARTDFSGQPARRHRETLRGQAAVLRLASIITDLEELVKERESRG